MSDTTGLDVGALRVVAEVAADDMVEFRRGVAKMGTRTTKGVYVATFDPPTVLALLDRLEAAEAAVERVLEVAGALEEAAQDGNRRPESRRWIADAANMMRLVLQSPSDASGGDLGRLQGADYDPFCHDRETP